MGVCDLDLDIDLDVDYSVGGQAVTQTVASLLTPPDGSDINKNCQSNWKRRNSGSH